MDDLNRLVNQAEGFTELLFEILQQHDSFFAGKFAMICWSIWRQRNEKLWNHAHASPAQTVFSALDVLMRAKNMKDGFAGGANG
ncbi:hypothetical protein PTKIN_Ptkin04bG0018300 [Pterospermum kingtungense]